MNYLTDGVIVPESLAPPIVIEETKKKMDRSCDDKRTVQYGADALQKLAETLSGFASDRLADFEHDLLQKDQPIRLSTPGTLFSSIEKTKMDYNCFAVHLTVDVSPAGGEVIKLEGNRD